MSIEDHAALLALSRIYFDALYQGDAAQFAAVFHPDAYLHSNGGNAYVHMGLSAYLEIVRNRAAPASRGEARKDEVLGISFLSPTLAVLTTREVFLPKLFTDVLVVMKFGNDWKIVSKTWDFTLISPKQGAGE